MHALHTVHAVPDLRVAAGRLRDGVSSKRPLFDHANSLFRSDHYIARLYHRGDFFAFANTGIFMQRWSLNTIARNTG
jgi:hypothetical protein